MVTIINITDVNFNKWINMKGKIRVMIKNRIKILRAINNMTQKELADEVHLTRQTISSIEKGKYSLSLEMAFKIARTFNVNITEVFQDDID